MTSKFVRDVVAAMESFAPLQLAMAGDVVGLQIGRLDKPVSHVRLALEASPEVIAQACQDGVDMLVTHHALLYRPVTKVDTATARGGALAQALAHNLTVYSAHTNLDIADGGVNDVLAELLQLSNTEILDDGVIPLFMGKSYGLGRVGDLKAPLRLTDFAARCRDRLGLTHIRFAGDPETHVQRVAIVGGSGSKWIAKSLARGAQVLLTGDCDHHSLADAWQDGLAVVDATHASLERPVLKRVKEVLDDALDALANEVRVDIAGGPEDPFHWL